MKSLYIPLLLIVSSYIFGADDSPLLDKATQLYLASEFKAAIHYLAWEILAGDSSQTTRHRLAQCETAVALKTKNKEALRNAIALLVKADKCTQFGNHDQVIAFAGEGFGDTVMFARFLQLLNENRKKHGLLPEVPLHLEGIQSKLLPILQRSGVTSTITTGKLNRDQNQTIMPLLSVVDPKYLFEEKHKKPYLVPREDVLHHWKTEIAKHTHRLNIATSWRCDDKPTISGRILQRSLPLKTIIDIARTVDPNAHIYLVQGKPHHNIVMHSAFETMSEDDKRKNELNVIPDDYKQYVTQVPDHNGDEPHGAFEDTLALLSLCIYIGADTVTAHMSGNVANGQAIMMLPSRNKDGTSNRGWRWTEGNPEQSRTTGETTAWYDDNTFRLFEINPYNAEEIAPVIQLLKQWYDTRELKRN